MADADIADRHGIDRSGGLCSANRRRGIAHTDYRKSGNGRLGEADITGVNTLDPSIGQPEPKRAVGVETIKIPRQ